MTGGPSLIPLGDPAAVVCDGDSCELPPGATPSE